MYIGRPRNIGIYILIIASLSNEFTRNNTKPRTQRHESPYISHRLFTFPSSQASELIQQQLVLWLLINDSIYYFSAARPFFFHFSMCDSTPRRHNCTRHISNKINEITQSTLPRDIDDQNIHTHFFSIHRYQATIQSFKHFPFWAPQFNFLCYFSAAICNNDNP